ncbi:MAG TPA: hypothetical protein VFC99_15130 [Acidimicrobiia bacterium]|nr:hypothetical protein [Acidimicrobiia bacterium]
MAVDRPITRDDIEAKLREVQRATEAGADAAKGAGVAAGAAAAGVVVVLVFLLGRRSGKKKRTIIEVRRV